MTVLYVDSGNIRTQRAANHIEDGLNAGGRQLQHSSPVTTQKIRAIVMSAPTSDLEFSKNLNDAGHSPHSPSLRDKERESEGTDGLGSGHLSHDLDQDSDPEYASSFRLIIIMCTLGLSTLIAALDLVSIIHPSMVHN